MCLLIYEITIFTFLGFGIFGATSIYIKINHVMDNFIPKPITYYCIMERILVLSVCICCLAIGKIFLFPARKHFTAKQIIDLHGGAGSLKGKTVIVTGGNSGIGLEACKALLFGGARVILCSRSISAAEQAVAEEIVQPGISGYVASRANLVVKALDLNSLKSIKSFADDVLATEPALDMLVMNAGIMALPKREETADGFEKQIGVNHFGHAYLGSLLENRLAEGKTASAPGRVVVLSSIAHNMGSVLDSSDLHFNKGRKYGQWSAYGQSKQANLLYARSLDEHFQEKKLPLVAVSLHPGAIQTKLWRSTGAARYSLICHYLCSFVLHSGYLVLYVCSGIGAWIASLVVMDKTIPEGASTTLWACVSGDVLKSEVRGGYLVDCAPAKPTTADARDDSGAIRKALWKTTFEQLKEKTAKLGL